MQLPHPIYDMGQFLLEIHVAEMKVMLAQIGSRADLSDATKQRMAYFQALADRFESVIPVLKNWCASAQKIHNDPKADKYSYGQIRQLLGGTDDFELEYGTGHLLAELSNAITELAEKPDSPARSAGLHIMGSAYTYFYSLFMYFHNVHPYT